MPYGQRRFLCRALEASVRRIAVPRHPPGLFIAIHGAEDMAWPFLANLLTSLSFTLAHLASHSTSWSLLVLIPSLCFGFVRDRFGSVYPSIILHVFYNTGYFLLIGGATFLNFSR